MPIGAARAEADLPPDDDGQAALERLAGGEPTPELAAQAAEECRRLLHKLGDEELCSLAVWQMEGYTVEEIAAKLGRSSRTAGRKLSVIRAVRRGEGGG
jgi:DNA-directed RNA polymerase specialized sigma24 family protein